MFAFLALLRVVRGMVRGGEERDSGVLSAEGDVSASNEKFTALKVVVRR
jgi:hypothetical protein